MTIFRSACRLAFAGALGAGAFAAAERPARATEFQMRGAAVGLGSSWRDDGAAMGSLSLAARFGDLASVYFLGRVGYAGIDQRMLTLVQVGGQIWGRLGKTRPYFRFGLVHQHEESWAAVQGDVFGAMFGVGDGIRHRAGLEWGTGVDVPFAQVKKTQFFASAEALLTWFPDARGPSIYAGGSLGLGFNYAL